MPISHITNCTQFLESLLNEYKARDLLANDFKTIANVEIEMKKLHKLVAENYALNSMKGLSSVNISIDLFDDINSVRYGIILCKFITGINVVSCSKIWYDHIFWWDYHWLHQMPYYDFRSGISLRKNKTEHGKSNISFVAYFQWIVIIVWLFQKTKKEKFLEQLFSIPILNIELHEHDAYPRKMRIIAENASHVNYTVTFSATRKKKQFMDAIRTQRNAPGRNH